MSSQRITVLMVNQYPDYIDANVWADGLKGRVPGLEFRVWPDAGSKYDIDIALIDKGAKPGFFDAMTSCAPSSTWARVWTASISTAFPEMSL